jgi:hypothetical protein
LHAHEVFDKPLEMDASSPEAAKAAVSQAAQVQLTKGYEKDTQLVADEISNAYDEITAHGLNNVSAKDGIKQAFQRYSHNHPGFDVNL